MLVVVIIVITIDDHSYCCSVRIFIKGVYLARQSKHFSEILLEQFLLCYQIGIRTYYVARLLPLGILYATAGFDSFLEFVTGYTLEKSLSIDNMFVFIIIFSSLGIPHQLQHKVLSVGIISAVAMRIPLIIAGISLLESFHWMMYVFGAFLIVTAIRMTLHKKEKEKIDIERNIAVRLLKKFIPLTST